MDSINQSRIGMQLYNAEGRQLYLTEDERRAFVTAAASENRPTPAGRGRLRLQVKPGCWFASRRVQLLAF